MHKSDGAVSSNGVLLKWLMLWLLCKTIYVDNVLESSHCFIPKCGKLVIVWFYNFSRSRNNETPEHTGNTPEPFRRPSETCQRPPPSDPNQYSTPLNRLSPPFIHYRTSPSSFGSRSGDQRKHALEHQRRSSLHAQALMFTRNVKSLRFKFQND